MKNIFARQELSHAGFTLTEILVVISIIAIVTTISIPFYRSITMNLSLNAAARDLASDLRYAQQLSVTTQINYLTIFYPSANYYNIINSQTSSTVKTRKIKEPITISSIDGLTDNTVSFNATGAASASSTIILTNPNNRQAIIEIKPSGYVKIQ